MHPWRSARAASTVELRGAQLVDRTAPAPVEHLGYDLRVSAEPPRSRAAASRSDRQEEDWGGCRCQALRLTGDAAATDPVCRFSLHRRTVVAARKATQADEFTYRTTRRPARV